MKILTPELFIFQNSKILPSRKAAPDSNTLQYGLVNEPTLATVVE